MSKEEITRRANEMARDFGLKRRRNESNAALLNRIVKKMPLDTLRRLTNRMGQQFKEVMSTDDWLERWKR